MRVTLWGTRGSLAVAGPETVRYGGNTSCVEVRGANGVLILDAGSGVRRLGESLVGYTGRVDILLTHLHMDHIQGLGFFTPLFAGGGDVHIWGPAASGNELASRLKRYLAPPLFPVRLRDFGPRVVLHAAPAGRTSIGEFDIQSDRVVHPGATVGYRISDGAGALAYLPDHEPALGARQFPIDPAWTSGFRLARSVDVLIHDTQYTAQEYASRNGWGHSSADHTVALAELAGVRRLVTFHHDPAHDDATLDAIHRDLAARARVAVDAGVEGMTLTL